MHPKELEEFFFKNDDTYMHKYPETFDPSWIVFESEWPYFRLSALDDQPYKEMYNEALALIDEFYDHREDTYGHGWKSLTLHGLNEDTQSLNQYIGHYKDRKDVLRDLKWTSVADKCPITKKYLTEAFPAEYLNRVRFMLLEPGGYILPHQDRPDSQKRLSVCNISLNNPEDCKFIMEGHGTVPFDNNGSAFLVDVSNKHAVWNKSSKPRLHMIVHFELGRKARDFFYILRESYFKNRDA